MCADQVNFGLHDLNNNGKEVPIDEYSANIKSIFATIQVQQPTAKLIFSTSTPVPVGDGGGSRTEEHVLEYNNAARAALPAVRDLVACRLSEDNAETIMFCVFCRVLQ